MHSPSPHAPLPTPLAGGRLQGLPFRILDVLGQGGMARVYRAVDAAGREVALKVLLAQGSAQQVERLIREGTHAADLAHPNLARLLDVGVVRGQPYLSYELIEDARPLDRVFAEVGLAQRVRLLVAVADGVAHAHAQGVVHRDLKPENVLVDRALSPRVMDFGLSLGDEEGRLTLSGAMVGTPHWMAPEQVTSRREEQGPASDVWALGVLLYQALTDELPFQGADLPELFVAITEGKPERPRSLAPDVSPALERVCLRALALEPAARYPDAGAFRDALEQALAAPPSRRGRFALGLALGAALVAVAVGAVALRPSAAPEPGLALTDLEAALDAGDPGAPAQLEAFLRDHPLSAAAWRLRGEAFANEGAWAAATEAFERSLALEEDPQALTGLAISLVKLGRLDEAERALAAASAFGPERAYTHAARALLNNAQERYPAAIEAAEFALTLDPSYRAAHVNLAQALEATSDLPRAEAAFRDALALGSDASTRCDLVRVLCKQGRFAEAQPIAEAAQAEAPTDPRPLAALGQLAFAERRFERALERFDASLALEPDAVRVLVCRGWTYLCLERPQEARQDFERVLDLARDDPAARAEAERGLKKLSAR